MGVPQHSEDHDMTLGRIHPRLRLPRNLMAQHGPKRSHQMLRLLRNLMVNMVQLVPSNSAPAAKSDAKSDEIRSLMVPT